MKSRRRLAAEQAPLMREGGLPAWNRSEHVQCPLCLHEYERSETTVHHLIPKSRGGTFLQTVRLCRNCHRQVHALFTEKELEREYPTIGALLAAETLQPWLAFIRKRKPTGHLPVRSSASKGAAASKSKHRSRS